jgi:hypothetical protein
MALAREIKETGLGVAVGPAGYVHSGAGRGGTSSAAAAAEGGGVVEGGGVGGVNPSSINPASANSAFLTSSRLPYVLPDGTPVEISTSSRCDVVELYFGNDDYDASYREDKLDEAVRALERYEVGIEEFLAEKDEDGGGEVGCGESSARMGNGGNGGNGDGGGVGRRGGGGSLFERILQGRKVQQARRTHRRGRGRLRQEQRALPPEYHIEEIVLRMPPLHPHYPPQRQ